MQKVMDSARAAARASLDESKASLRSSVDTVSAVGIGHVQLVQQMIAGAQHSIQEAEQALETIDVDGFTHAVEKAAYAVQELDGIVKQETKHKEDEDVRQSGRLILDDASQKLEELKREAEDAGVRQSENFITAAQAVENEIAAVSLLMSGDPLAFLAACKAISNSLEDVRAALKGERLKKEKNDQQRQMELARLRPSLAKLREIQAVLTQTFELASEELLINTVAAAVQTIDQLIVVLEKSDNVASLRDRVDAAIRQSANAEKLFAEVKQRQEIRSRDIASAKTDMEALEKRLELLIASIAGEDLLSHLVEGQVNDARNGVDDVDRAIRRVGPNAGDVLRAVVSVAMEKIDNLDHAIQDQRQRLVTTDKARNDELMRLELAERRLSEITSGIGDSALRDKQAVKDVLAVTDAAVRTAGERLHRPVTFAWLQHDEIKQERAAVNDAISKVETAETVVLEEKRRYESLIRDQRANQANLDFAAAKLSELKDDVEENKLDKVPSVQAAVEECEAAHAYAVKSTDAGLDDAETGKKAVAQLLEKIKRAETIVAGAKTQKDAEEKEKSDIQDKLDNVLMKLQGVVAMVEAAGPTVMKLTETPMREASAAVNAATKLLRRGDNLKELSTAVRAAVNKVDAVESTARSLKDSVEQASKLKSSVSKKLASLVETLLLSHNKADSANLTSASSVEAALRAADEALTAAKRKIEGDVETWMRDGLTIAKLVDDAAFKVEAAEEAVDDEMIRREKIQRERDELLSALDILADRHDAVLKEIKDVGVGHVDAVVKAVEAAEAEFTVVRNSLTADGSTRALLIQLPRLVAIEEDVCHMECRKLEARSAEVQKAAGELPSLQEKIARLEVLVEAAAETLPSSCDLAFRQAQKAVKDVERFVSEGLNASMNQPVPRMEAVLAVIQKATELIHKHHAHLQSLEGKRADAKTRVAYLERRYADLEEDVADFCSKSDHLRVQLDAEWGSNCWWGSQTSHTQTDGTPIGRGEMKPISKVTILSESVAAAEAAMLAARKSTEADIAFWCEKGSSSIYRALDEALNKIEKASDVLEQEKMRVAKEDQDRRNAMKVLDKHTDRLSKLKVNAESRNVHNEKAVVEAFRAADNALDIVAKVLEVGNAAASPPAMDVAVKKIVEAEEVMFVELQRKDRYEAQRLAAKEEVTRLQARAKTIDELVQLLNLGEVTAIADALRAVTKSIERAGIAINSEQAIAIINKEVRTILQKIEVAEREVRRERVRRDEMSKLKAKQEQEAHIRALKEAEEERRKAEQERLQRIALESEMEKLGNRLAQFRPNLDKLHESITVAEGAVKSAKGKITEGGGLVAAQAAVQSAVEATNGFEVVASSLWGPKTRASKLGRYFI